MYFSQENFTRILILEVYFPFTKSGGEDFEYKVHSVGLKFEEIKVENKLPSSHKKVINSCDKHVACI
jgi:hypothetical protein